MSRIAPLLAALVALAVLPTVARAVVTEDNFKAQTAGDLAALCAADSADPMAAAAVHFCEGYGQGAYAVIDQYQKAHKAAVFCLPSPPPTRTQALLAYVDWVKAVPGRAALPAADSVYDFLRTQYPCAAKKP